MREFGLLEWQKAFHKHNKSDNETALANQSNEEEWKVEVIFNPGVNPIAICRLYFASDILQFRPDFSGNHEEHDADDKANQCGK